MIYINYISQFVYKYGTVALERERRGHTTKWDLVADIDDTSNMFWSGYSMERKRFAEIEMEIEWKKNISITNWTNW